MNKIVVICIGKLKMSCWKDACAHYLQQLKPWRRIEVLELRDSTRPVSSRGEEEAKRIMDCLRADYYPIALIERGKSMSSPQLADFLRDCLENKMKAPAFIIGGPYGLADSVIEKCEFGLSLSALTWTHELARVLLLEQLYRAESILRHTPYHH